MHYNFRNLICGNLPIILITSYLLNFVVVSINADDTTAKIALGRNAAGATDTAATSAAAVSATANSDTLNSNNAAHDEVLPNYKKVKKLTSAADLPSAATADVHFLKGATHEHNANADDSQHWSDLSAIPLPLIVDSANDASVNPINGKSVDVISDLPKEVEKGAGSSQTVHEEPKEATVANTMRDESLPDITDIPAVTVTELPLEMLGTASTSSLNAITIDVTTEFVAHEPENRTLDILEKSNEALHKDDQIIKINDSGGGEPPNIESINIPIKIETKEHIPNDNTTTTNSSTQNEQEIGSDAAAAAAVNRTVEETPIPVFSEWAQKQMEAAEKQQAMEQEVINTSAQKKNHTNGNGKPAPLKRRAKNYASPDCGAKIIASNADATNTAAVLSSSKDEYMLSPCGNRIWFVVELCEAIQAQKIDLANFELFSSSPKNFTVAVSNRFPTRDWSNVGRFIAEDKRNVQSFELHPHLFGKFVRVDIHSHYSKEHFCPVSLFRVFGTSEFEAFETENQLNEDLEDFDEEFGLEQAQVRHSEQTIFKSASDAVLSIVKKAAEVLVKPASSSNLTQPGVMQAHMCRSPAFGQFSCAECNDAIVERINNALSCEYEQLNNLLNLQRLQKELLNTQVCAKQYGIQTKPLDDDCATKMLETSFEVDVKQSYFLNILPTEYVGALCQLLSDRHTRTDARSSLNNSVPDATAKDESADIPLNLTIDKKLNSDDFKIDNPKKIVFNPQEATIPSSVDPVTESESSTPTTERNIVEEEQLLRPPETDNSEKPPTLAPEIVNEPAKEVNIFNVPTVEERENIDESIEVISNGGSDSQISNPTGTTPEPITITTTTTTTAPRSEEDPTAWDNLDNLLTSTVASPGMAPQASTNGANLQQKIPNAPQSESVFIRLSNRIKALERNMSLSGQYLEELSRTYKKQVEELQQTLTQQSQTVRTLEEQNRRHSELEHLSAQRNTQLKGEIDELTLQVHACIVVIIFVGAFVFFLLLVAILFYRSMRRETKELLSLHTGDTKRKPTIPAAAVSQTKLRRKSFEDFSDHQHTQGKNSEKQRRPSEEAMLILKECGDTSEALIEKQDRQRKMSVCYNGTNSYNPGFSTNSTNNSRANGPRRRSDKYSCPNTTYIQQQARKYLKQLIADDYTTEENDQFLESDALSRQYSAPHELQQKNKAKFSNGHHVESLKGAKSKKKIQGVKRQASAPSEFNPRHESRLNVTAPAVIVTSKDANHLLDDDGLENFIPNADLAYNEFMPDGPSGYQIATDAATDAVANKKIENATIKKTRRLSSPAFFKSPFSKSLKPKAGASKTNPPHESTSWEWYRSKKSEAQQHKQDKRILPSSASATGFPHAASPSPSLDSSSLSEIHFPTNSTENSFRILEEAILSSGESVIATGASAVFKTTTNGNGHSGSSGGSSSSNRSSTSSNSKKKKHTFNKIFRKVF